MASFSPPLLSTTTLVIAALVLLRSASQSHADPLAQNCPDSGSNYTANSTYQANLLLLLTSLTSNVTTAGYYASGSIGSVPDIVNALVFCRGDVSLPDCRSCLATGSQDIQQLCPYKKTAVVWYETCLLRYSNQRILSVLDNGYKLYMWNVNNVTSEWSRFNQSLVGLLDGLAQYAAYNASAAPPRLFATGEIPLNREYPRIYGLVQCSRDLSSDDCAKCLKDIIGDLPNCCSGKIGGRVLATSCNFRYEIASFYNGTSRLSLPPLAATAPAPAPATGSPPLLLSPPAATNSTNSTTDSSGTGIKTGTILAIAIPVGTAGVLILTLCICCLRRKKAKKQHSLQEIPPIESLLFNLSTIRNATNNFSESNKLGEGGFGAVYKGLLLPGGQEIAVKRLSTGSGQGIDELKNEVALLAKLQHRNLVRLLGICLEEEEKILIYEYVQNRSLDTFLFDPNKKDQLYWERRYKIISGIARGLLYLHEESQVKIIHRDLKASNILLDVDMNPKISDFGLARLFGGDQTEANTSRVVGTFGYMSPEYAMRGQFSNKSDVFSFGVIILEIVTGQKSNNFFTSGNSADLLSYVWGKWSRGAVMDILDPNLSRSCPKNEALRCIQIGLLCVQENPADRPTMSSVILMLNSYSVSIQVPLRPAFIMSYTQEWSIGERIKTDSSSVSPTKFITKSEIYSPNEMSVTELDPR